MRTYDNEDEEDNDDDDNDDDEEEDNNNDSNHNNSDDESLKVFTIQDIYLGSPAEVEDDVNSAYSKGLLTEEGKEILTKLNKAIRVKKLPSDTISIYKQKKDDPEFNPKLLSDQHKYVFTPFVKVINVKGRMS